MVKYVGASGFDIGISNGKNIDVVLSNGLTSEYEAAVFPLVVPFSDFKNNFVKHVAARHRKKVKKHLNRRYEKYCLCKNLAVTKFI